MNEEDIQRVRMCQQNKNHDITKRTDQHECQIIFGVWYQEKINKCNKRFTNSRIGYAWRPQPAVFFALSLFIIFFISTENNHGNIDTP